MPLELHERRGETLEWGVAKDNRMIGNAGRSAAFGETRLKFARRLLVLSRASARQP